jgi:Zn finger protein HypA/HybF involved in hydrogenase expression
MGTMLEVRCNDCGGLSHQIDGATFAGYRPRCDRCGVASLVPPGDAPPTVRAITDGSALVTTGAASRSWGTCPCGGTLSPNAPVRCPHCRSEDVAVTTTGYAD